MTNIKTAYLPEMIRDIDSIYSNGEITRGEYMIIGLLMKILEAAVKE